MKIEHKTNRHGFYLTIETDEATIKGTDITEYTKGENVIPEKTIDKFLEITVDAILYNSKDNKKFVSKIFEQFDNDQLNEALLYLCEKLNVEISEK